MDLRKNFLDHVKKGLGGHELPLRLVFWDGHAYDFADNPIVTMHLKSAKVVTSLLMGSALDVLGEGYVEGDIDIEGRYQDILAVAEGLSNAFPSKKSSKTGIIRKALHSKNKDKEAIHYHYDVSNDFYQLWQDRNLVYSCGYFKTGEEDIDTAQEQKPTTSAASSICSRAKSSSTSAAAGAGC